MRQDVSVEFGGQQYALRPSFEVLDAFEERHGGILDHLHKLAEGMAPLSARAFLVLKALEAGNERPAHGGWSLDAVKRRMFDRGIWHEDMVRAEAELIERLMYTPEQYARKKEAEKEQEAALSEALNPFSEMLSGSPRST